jgi:hypothetical protein
MLRRPCLSRPPSILNLRRLAYTSSYRPLRHPSTALAASLDAQGLSFNLAKNAKDANASKPKPIKVTDPQTKREITVDLNTVQPFTPEFALLPLEHRTLVERRHLSETLKKRLASVYDDGPRNKEEKTEIKPDSKIVDQYLSKFIRNRRAKIDEIPSEEKIQQLIDIARRKAIKKEKRRLNAIKGVTTVEDTLSFEEQWRRRQAYGRILSYRADFRRHDPQINDIRVHSSIQSETRSQESRQAT